MGSGAVGVGQPADLVTRFLAKLIDWVGLIIVLVVVGVVFAFIGFAGAASGVGGGFGMGGSFVFGLISTVINTAIVYGYFSLMEGTQGKTIGKMLLKLEVRGPDGQKPTTEVAFKRNGYMLLYLLNVIPFIGWLLWLVAWIGINVYIAVGINSAPDRRGWHDTFAGGTSVIKVG